MISGIILAAGESSRFGSLKQLYKLDGKSFLNRIIDNLQATFNVTEIIVGLGYKYESIIKHIDTDKVKVVINSNYQRGQLSTFQECIKKVSTSSRGYLMTLVDHPFIKIETYNMLIGAFLKNNFENIVIPTYKGRKGHPVIFPAVFKKDIMDAPLNEGARYVTNKNIESVQLVETDDEFVLADIDNEEDLKHWSRT